MKFRQVGCGRDASRKQAPSTLCLQRGRVNRDLGGAKAPKSTNGMTEAARAHWVARAPNWRNALLAEAQKALTERGQTRVRTA